MKGDEEDRKKEGSVFENQKRTPERIEKNSLEWFVGNLCKREDRLEKKKCFVLFFLLSRPPLFRFR
jgi:hypothetical protein